MSDLIITLIQLLKNNWSLIGDLSISRIRFGSRFYDSNVIFPQLIVIPKSGNASPPIDFGASTATYEDTQTLGLQIIVRPNQDSNSSIGWAKNAIWKMRKEVERILRSGSYINFPTENFNSVDFNSTDFDTSSTTGESTFMYNIRWRRIDDLTMRSKGKLKK
jgi:hypothetical protein